MARKKREKTWVCGTCMSRSALNITMPYPEDGGVLKVPETLTKDHFSCDVCDDYQCGEELDLRTFPYNVKPGKRAVALVDSDHAGDEVEDLDDWEDVCVFNSAGTRYLIKIPESIEAVGKNAVLPDENMPLELEKIDDIYWKIAKIY